VKVFAQFITAATDVAHFPAPGPPEVAFLGRSNVGKSSVINSLLGHKVARTSSTPGRTRGINFYAIRWPGKPRPELMFTDLPGYGYAKVPRELSAGWHAFIEPYLKERPNLALCVSLVDSNIPPQPGDQQLCEFLRSVRRPHLVVATKAENSAGHGGGAGQRGAAFNWHESLWGRIAPFVICRPSRQPLNMPVSGIVPFFPAAAWMRARKTGSMWKDFP
jgi:GTP-binding protein